MKLVWSQEGKVSILETDPLAESQPGRAQTFRNEIVSFAKAKKSPYVLFDVGNSDYPDRSAIDDLLICNRLIRKNGGAFMLLSPPGRLWEHLQAEGATNLIPYRWDRAEALAEFLHAITEGEVMDRLLLGNKLTYRPSLLVRVRKFSAAAPIEPSEDEVPIPSAEAVDTTPVAPPTPAPPPPEPKVAPPPVKELKVPPTPEMKKADWTLTLEVYHTAATLARKHDIPFDQTMSFEDYMSAMSEKLM